MDKANFPNNYFTSVFTQENILNITVIDGPPFADMESITVYEGVF